MRDGVSNHKHKAIAYGLFNPGDSNNKKSRHSDLRDLTLSWLRFGYQGPVIESDSVDTILETALNEGHDACFIQMPGNIINEEWKLPHWEEADFYDCLQQILGKNKFLICVNTYGESGYFAIDKSCFLVDLGMYQKMGCPCFGEKLRGHKNPIKPRLTQTELGSDLDKMKEYLDDFPKDEGWGFIEASMASSLWIPQLPDLISQKRVRVTSNSLNGGEGILQKRFLKSVESQIERGRSGVFLWNIESYQDVPECKNQTISSKENPESDYIRQLYCVAAGFKPNMLLHRHGFNKETVVRYFDYSQQALDIRKILLEEWNGTDYPKFCKTLVKRFPEANTFYQLWNGLTLAQINWNDVECLWEQELAQWGGEDVFQQQWLMQQKLTSKFVHCDVINNPNPLLEEIDNTEGSVIWWSNAFFTISSNWLMSIDQRRERFRYWIQQLAEKTPYCRLYGADHNNTPVNGVDAITYLGQFEKRSLNTVPDELVPQRQLAKPIRF